MNFKRVKNQKGDVRTYDDKWNGWYENNPDVDEHNEF